MVAMLFCGGLSYTYASPENVQLAKTETEGQLTAQDHPFPSEIHVKVGESFSLKFQSEGARMWKCDDLPDGMDEGLAYFDPTTRTITLSFGVNKAGTFEMKMEKYNVLDPQKHVLDTQIVTVIVE